MAFVKISEQASLYDDLEKKTVGEILRDINNEDKKVALAVEKAIPQIEKLVSQIVPRMKRGGRIFYIGAGTSGRLGVLDASEIPPTFGMEPTWVIGLIAGGDTALRNPVENAEDNTTQGWKDLEKFNINNKDTVIGIAASGTTPYVIGALNTCREHGILTAAMPPDISLTSWSSWSRSATAVCSSSLVASAMARSCSSCSFCFELQDVIVVVAAVPASRDAAIVRIVNFFIM